MTDDVRRAVLRSLSVPLFVSAGCLGLFDRDDTVKVTNERDEEHAVTVRFVDENAGSIVSERELTLRSGAEAQYKVELPNAGHESQRYAAEISTESGLRETHDLGEGVFYILYVNLEEDGIRAFHTVR